MRRGFLAYPFSLSAICVFTGLLLFALWRLGSTEETLRLQAGDNMLWTIAQAQVAAQRLDAEIARARLGEASPEALELRYHVLLSRLSLLKDGPQRRYLEELDHFDQVVRLGEPVFLHADAFLSANRDEVEPNDVLERLASRLGRAANDAMVAHLDRTGAQLDRQHAAIVQVAATTTIILLLGAFISWRMITALQQQQQTSITLQREQEARPTYRSFLALVSHQLRTPLAVIDSSMQRMLRKGEAMERDEIEHRARRVRATVKTMTDLMQATLDSMKLEDGRVDIRLTDCAIAAEMETARQRQYEAHADRTIRLDIAREVPATVKTDPLLLQQIVGNLLSNALAYSPKTESVAVKLTAGSDRLRIAVVDNGLGIPDDEQNMVFEPFFRASTGNKVHGTGIGLHLSRRLARMLGGDITFESQHGVGSVFVFELPAVVVRP